MNRPWKTSASTNEPSEDETREPTEFEIVLSNIEKNLRDECGCNPVQAARLAEQGVDWHELKALLDRGCDLPTAIDLVL